MTELDKMKAFSAMEEIKDAPQWARETFLITICRTDKTGRIENVARILASHKMPTNEIVPCIMELMQCFLMDIEADGKEILK